jgi:hypothetical protein
MPEFILVISPDNELVGKLTARCVVCQLPAYVSNSLEGAKTKFKVFCSRCGRYEIFSEGTMSSKLQELTPSQVANASGYLRENSPFVIRDDQDIDFLDKISTPTVAAKAHKLLSNIARCNPTPGTFLRLRFGGLDEQMKHFVGVRTSSRYPVDNTADRAAMELFPALSMAWAENESELRFLLIEYLVKGVGFLSQEGAGDSHDLAFRISSKGWEHLQAQGMSDSSTAFVAMWFNEEVNSVWEQAIYPAIDEAGYSPLRIDKKHHNNKIDDEIIASIRGAKFVVADFTGQRGGVYYEAGFAGGLGKPVIWCVRNDDISNLHFDTRQFNHLVWSPDDLQQFKEDLRLRILSTLGKGPLKTAASTLRA